MITGLQAQFLSHGCFRENVRLCMTFTQIDKQRTEEWEIDNKTVSAFLCLVLQLDNETFHLLSAPSHPPPPPPVPYGRHYSDRPFYSEDKFRPSLLFLNRILKDSDSDRHI